jgi:predicted amidophosphoribosyltransferase
MLRRRQRPACPHCHAPIGRLDDECPACGKPTGQRQPFYVYLLGAAIVLVLFLALADLPALAQFFASLAGLFRS